MKSRRTQAPRPVPAHDTKRGLRADRLDIDDLPTQLEALLDQVWRCEAAWRRDDRIDRAIRNAR